jgi:hypothetical protein
MLSTFSKLVIGFLLLEVATVLAYLLTGELPSLSEAYIKRPIVFWLYVAAILLAALYGRRAYNRIVRLGKRSIRDTPGSDRLSVFYPAVRVLADPIRYANRHPRYLNRLAYLVIGFAILILCRIIFLPWTVPSGGGQALEFITSLVFPLFTLILLFEEYYRGYLFQLKFLRRVHAKQKFAVSAIHEAEILRVKNKEQEDVMALVAHKFRGSLDRIIYNIDHENSEWVSREAVNTMRGLLEIFSLISTDTALLRRKLREDNQGSAALEAVTTRSLGLALGQLLSLRGSERIQQHFFSFARRRQLIPESAKLRDWYEEYGDLAEQLRRGWESSLMERLPGAGLTDLCDWTAERFFPLHTEGFVGAPVHFAPYGTTESLLTILLTEGFTNMFKYYASSGNSPARADWSNGGDEVNLRFSNPTTPNASAMVKGSGRGHDFLRLLIEKLDGTVRLGRDGETFTLALQLPAPLFMEHHR